MQWRDFVNVEPSLTEMLNDPIVRLLMDKDGADEANIRRLIAGLGRPRLTGQNPIPFNNRRRSGSDPARLREQR